MKHPMTTTIIWIEAIQTVNINQKVYSNQVEDLHFSMIYSPVSTHKPRELGRSFYSIFLLGAIRFLGHTEPF
jgi:hypothetical protein